MIRFALFILVVMLCACVSKPPRSDKVFSNAQILYSEKEKNSILKRRNMEMASYFMELDYAPNQTTLNKAQINKIESVFNKLIYPEEYKLYVSFGADNADSQLASLAPIFKRAEDIKRNYGGRVKNLQIAYIKNQKSNIAFLRLMS